MGLLDTWTATGIAEAVRSGSVDPVAATEESLRRISERDTDLGAFQVVRADHAPAEAAAVGTAGVLAGVPIAVKDNVDVAGEPTRDGSLASSPDPKAADHEVVRRLRAAGAVVVGKTKVPELCVFGATDSPFGVTRNPWEPSRTPGGSSGGSAAAVAAGMVPVAHGNDGMGSVRIPAAACGLVGIKPGAGVVPCDLGSDDWRGLAENGALATTVADVALVLSVMADRPDLAAVSEPSGRLRIAVAIRQPSPAGITDRHYRTAARDAGRVLADAGHDVRAVRVPYSVRFTAHAIARWTAGTNADAESYGRDKLQTSIRRHADVGRFLDRRGWVVDESREQWRERLRPFFDEYDVLLTPALARPPIRAVRWGARGWLTNVAVNATYAPYTHPWNLAGYPALAVPHGRHPIGVPLAVQLVAPSGGEALLLSVARQLEALAPWPRVAPAYAA